MTLPKLNRIFTVTASSERQVSSPIEWRYDAYSAEPLQGYFGLYEITLPAVGKWVWTLADAIQSLSSVNTAQAVIDAEIDGLEIGRNSVNDDGTPNAVLPIPGDTLEPAELTNVEVRLGVAANFDTDYLRFMATGRSDYFSNDEKFREILEIEIDASTMTLVGSDFTFTETGEILITVAGQATSATLTNPVTFGGVWGEMFEEGFSESINVTGLELSTAATARATFRTRYRFELLSGDTVVDDLSRAWNVASSRVLRDRRFIEYDLTRLIGQN